MYRPVGAMWILIPSLLLAGPEPRPSAGQAASPSTAARNQNDHFVTTDVDRFFRAMESAKTSPDPVAVVQRDYLDVGTPGLRFYDESGRIRDAAAIWNAYRKHTDRYPAIRAFYEKLPDAFPLFERTYALFDSIYPGSVTPPVYFIVGHFQGGATAFPGGLVVALDNWATPWATYDPDHPTADLYEPREVLPQIVSHELVHFHQKCQEGCVERNLLTEAISEGSADFIAWLITGERANLYMKHIYTYLDEHEAEVWDRFRRDMLGTGPGVWLYNNDVEDIPENLGYAIGFRIAEAYYDGQPDKPQAMRDILEMQDGEAFLRASGYGPR